MPMTENDFAELAKRIQKLPYRYISDCEFDELESHFADQVRARVTLSLMQRITAGNEAEAADRLADLFEFVAHQLRDLAKSPTKRASSGASHNELDKRERPAS